MEKQKPMNINVKGFVEYCERQITQFHAAWGMKPKQIIMGPQEYMAACAFATALKFGDSQTAKIQKPLQFLGLPVIVKSTRGVEFGIDIEWAPHFCEKPSRIHRI